MRCPLIFACFGLMISASAAPLSEPDINLICRFLRDAEIYHRDIVNTAVNSTKTVAAEMIDELSSCKEIQPQLAALRDYLTLGQSISQESSLKDQMAYLHGFPSSNSLTTVSLMRCMKTPPLLAHTILGFVSNFVNECPKLKDKIGSDVILLKKEVSGETLARERQFFELIDDYENEKNPNAQPYLLDKILSHKIRDNC